MLTGIKLRDFRGHSDKNIILGKGINLLYGENGSGKTSILEAAYFALKGKSFRPAGITDLIKEGAECAVVTASMEVEGLRRTIARQLSRIGGVKTKIDGKDATSTRDSLPLQVVVFTQETTWVIKGDPAGRRDWMDGLIEQAFPEEEERIREYRRAVYQRNETLKRIRAGREREGSLSPWEEIIADKGHVIRERRIEVMRGLEKHIGEMRAEEEISLRYYGTFEDREDLLEKLRRSRQKDILRGVTGIGPHRDEILFLLEGRSLKHRGSQGQQRKVAIMLTIASSALLEEKKGIPCIPMLDDMPSELDEKVTGWLVERISEKDQVVVTANTNRLADFKGKVGTQVLI